MTADRIRRYLDDLGKLSARHGVWIENGGQGTLLHVSAEHAAGYQAWLRPSGGRDSVYEIDSYVRGAAPDEDGVIVGDDHSPEGKERRAREWREEYAEAIAERNGRVGPSLVPLPRPSDSPGKNGDL